MSPKVCGRYLRYKTKFSIKYVKAILLFFEDEDFVAEKVEDENRHYCADAAQIRPKFGGNFPLRPDLIDDDVGDKNVERQPGQSDGKKFAEFAF